MKNYMSKKELCSKIFKPEYATIYFKSKKIKRKELINIYKCEDYVEFFEFLEKAIKKVRTRTSNEEIKEEKKKIKDRIKILKMIEES